MDDFTTTEDPHMYALNPPLLPGQVGKLAFRGTTVAVRGEGTLNGAATENFGLDNTGACTLFDADAINETIGATPLATIGADTSRGDLDVAFAHGLVVSTSAWQACSIAVTPSPTAVFPS